LKMNFRPVKWMAETLLFIMIQTGKPACRKKHSTRFSYRQQIKKIPCAIFRSKLCASQKALPVYLPVNLLRNSQAGQLLKLHI
jgi:hypothetical protein